LNYGDKETKQSKRLSSECYSGGQASVKLEKQGAKMISNFQFFTSNKFSITKFCHWKFIIESKLKN